MSDAIDFVNSVKDGDTVKAKKQFDTLISSKIGEILDAKKIEVAAGIMDPQKQEIPDKE